MKRPQFRLMLVLLIVALFATIFAWQRAVRDREEADRHREIELLENRVKGPGYANDRHLIIERLKELKK